jgi:hypothetical protein
MNDFGDLHNYLNGEYIRPATQEEQQESREAAKHDGGVGVIMVDNRPCYITD